MRVLKSGVSLVTLASLLGATAITARAQQVSSDTGRGMIEEITVTATKRGEQRLQDVPATIQAFGGGDIEDLLATEFSDLAGFIPGLQFQDLGPGDKEYIIRGINSGGAATVGVYYDEAVITARNKQDGGGRQADIELHDLARVEVLKGPQGTLYGASSMSGTLRFIPNAPDPSAIDFNAGSQLSETEEGGTNYKLDAMINLPIVADKLALRVVGWTTDESGYVDNVRLDQKNINSNNVDGVRAALRFLPTDTLDFTVSALVQDRDVGGSSRFSPVQQDIFLDNLVAFDFPTPALGDLTNQGFTVDDWDEKIEIYGFKGEYDAGWGSFFATTNYFERKVDFRFDSTPILLFFGVPTPAVTFQPQKRQLWSNEIRFASNFDSPVNFVVGGFSSFEKKEFEVQVLATNELGRPSGAFDVTRDFLLDGPPGAAIFGRFVNDDIDELAAFGEVTWEVTDRLTILGGIRYYDFDFTSVGKETKPFFGFDDGTREIDIKTGGNTTQFKANASWRVSDDHLVYFTASEGFRIGGTNDAAINPFNVTVPEGFDPDSLWNYELGWKGALLDNRIQFNIAGYLIFWSDVQVEGIDPSGAFPLITNAGKARIDGVEFDVTLRPTPGLELAFGGSVQDARITEDQPLSDPNSSSFDPNAGLKGDPLPNVPDFQGFASAQYTYPLTQELDGLVRLDATYRGDTQNQLRGDSPFNVDLDNYALLNLKIGLSSEHWDLMLFARNLTDKRAQVDAINSAQDPLAFVTVRPRTWGADLRYRF